MSEVPLKHIRLRAPRRPCNVFGKKPPWRQPRGKQMVSLVNSHTNATRIGWHLWEIDLRFAPGLPPGWGRREALRELRSNAKQFQGGLVFKARILLCHSTLGREQ